MRLFEALTLIALLPALLGYFQPRHRRPYWLTFLPGVAVLFLLAHLFVEGWRCQMITTYALTVILLILSLKRLKSGSDAAIETPTRRRWVIVGAIAGLLVWGDAVLQITLIPVFRLPPPNGPYHVGRTRWQLVDNGRPETLSEDPDDKRTLLVQVWYPADTSAAANPAPYWENAPWLLNHLARVQSHGYADEPLAEAQPAYPVLIFSHGFLAGYAAQNTVLMEELASHGYVVFSIAHPYEALAVTYPDGRRVYFSSDRAKAIIDEYRVSSDYFHQRGLKGADIPANEELLRQQLVMAPLLDESLRIWTADTLFVLDTLAEMNDGDSDSIFSGKLDMERLGVMGMSFGGATAVQVCLVDNRCQAGASLDGPILGDLLDIVLERPFMMMVSHHFAANANDLIFERIENSVYAITIETAYHGDFSDFAIMSPLLKAIGASGPIEGQRMLAITSAYILAFFDRHLQGIETPLLDGPASAFPEVQYEVHTR